MTMLFFLGMVAIGAFSGVLSGLLGVGGGFIMVPLLSSAHFPMQVTVGTSNFYIMFAASAGVVGHLRQGSIDLMLAVPLIVGASVMTPLGAYAVEVLPASVLQILFAILTRSVAIALLRQDRKPGRHRGAVHSALSRNRFYLLPRTKQLFGQELAFRLDLRKGILVGSLVGFMTGLLGVGGGWLKVPLLVLYMKIPFPIAVGTSLVGIITPATIGAYAHWQLGNIDLSTALPLVPAGMTGAWIGTKLVGAFSASTLQRLLAGLLLAASMYMLAHGSRLF